MSVRSLPARGDFLAPANCTVAAALRAHWPGQSWNDVRALCSSGKISVKGERELNPARRLAGGETVAWSLTAPDPRRTATRPEFSIVCEDGHLIVIEKPEGVSSVPYERKERGTALDLIREAWRKQGKRATATPLYTVHRIDKDTSGLLCFAKTKLAERGLHQVFKQHLAEREYLAVAHGQVRPARIESRLIADRGDGLRGSTRRPNQGQHAVTHVEVIESLPAATLCRVRLETGRTHQIRIHLAEQGHPLVGETVYLRDHTRSGRALLPSHRLLLHAATLGFDHPVTGERLHFASKLPPSFEAELQRLRRH
jgi:23S rRNA pseudouridine1911/1915/1917 synthase